MYAGVPTILPNTVDTGPEPDDGTYSPASGSPTSWIRSRARPQSTTMVSPNEPTMMFEGLRSRWITPSLCA